MKFILFINSWRCLADILSFKIEFNINALYQQIDETLILYRSDFLIIDLLLQRY